MTPLAPAGDGASRVVGDYRLVRVLGRGSVGEVWLGVHLRTGSPAAVKLVRDVAGARDRLRSFFLRERRAIGRLSHPGIVSLYDVGLDYLVTSFVDGVDLGRALRTPFDPARAVRVAVQIASALVEAHANGVVHRDVKPSNVLLDTQGNAHLADFGSATILDDPDPGAPRAVGTPGFMAPEQRTGAPTGPAADQYALGRTLLVMLSGANVPDDREAALAELPRTLPRALVETVRRATDADPTARFPSMSALAEALAEIDLTGLGPPRKLATKRRDEAPFAWCAGGSVESRHGPDIVRVDFTLGRLVEAGLVDAARADDFRARSGYADFGWSMMGRVDRLGALTDPASVARVREIVVAVHGTFCTREMWTPCLVGVCRDNPEALVLFPDVNGFGLSPFRGREPQPGTATPVGLLRAIVLFTRLLGVADLPTVLLGHSMGALALLSAPDRDVGAHVARLALLPVFPFVDRYYRIQLALLRIVLRSIARFAFVKRQLARLLLEAPQSKPYTEATRRALAGAFVKMPPAWMAAIAEGYGASRPVQGAELQSATIVMGEDDPLAPERVVMRALAALEFPGERLHRLGRGGHFPHAEMTENPEWTARNVEDIVRLVDEALLTVRGLSPETDPTSDP